jgi:hypothetical protein
MCCGEELPFSWNIHIAVDDEQDAILPIFARERQFAGIGVARAAEGGHEINPPGDLLVQPFDH